VVRLLVQEGELTQESGPRDSWTVRIPEGVREVIGRRLNRLSQRCNETLTIASVVGREFELRQLAPLVEDMSEDRLLDVLEEALSARVIEELPQAVGRYQFTHALIQETLAAEFTMTRRVRLHAHIAESLEQLYGDTTEAHAAELAHHFAEAESVLGTEKLVMYSLLAGEKALASYAWEEALGHFERGMAAKGLLGVSTGALPDAEAAALLFGLGRAQAGTLPRHQLEPSLISLNLAFDYYADHGDIDKAVAVAEYRLPTSSGWRSEVDQRIERALALVPEDTVVAGQLLSLFGQQTGRYQSDYDGAQAAFEQALGIALRKQDLNLEMQTLAASANVDFYHLRYRESVEKSMRVVELARLVNDPHFEMTAQLEALRTLNLLGESKRAEEHAGAALALAEQLRERASLSTVLRSVLTHYRLMGDWKRASEFADRGLAVDPHGSSTLAHVVMLHYEIGESNKGETYLEVLLEVMRQSPGRSGPIYGFPAVIIPLVARITGVIQQLDLAKSAAETILSSPSPDPMFATYAKAALALRAILEENVEVAQEQYADLESHRGMMVPGALIGFDRLLGLLAHSMGNLEQATAHFEDSLAFCRKAGYRPELAWSCCDYADTLLQRNESGDREKAMSLLDESLTISSELGMRPLMERVLSRREILKA